MITRRSSSAWLAFGILFGLLVCSPTLIVAQTDSTIGTWRLNVAKSKYQPGPAAVSEMRVYEVAPGGGIKATFTRVEAGGMKRTITYTAMYDGKDYPYTGSPDADTIMLKRIDANTVEAVLKKNGKVSLRTRAVISPDGKTRTLTTTGTNAQGQNVNNLMIFERQ